MQLCCESRRGGVFRESPMWISPLLLCLLGAVAEPAVTPPVVLEAAAPVWPAGGGAPASRPRHGALASDHRRGGRGVPGGRARVGGSAVRPGGHGDGAALALPARPPRGRGGGGTGGCARLLRAARAARHAGGPAARAEPRARLVRHPRAWPRRRAAPGGGE